MVNGYSIVFALALPVRQFSEHLEICFWGPTLAHQKTALYACSCTYLLSYRHIIFSRNFIWDLALTKLYANCLLSTLNARTGIKESASHQSNQCHQISVTSGTSRLAVCFWSWYSLSWYYWRGFYQNPYMNDAVAHVSFLILLLTWSILFNFVIDSCRILPIRDGSQKRW